MGRRFALAGLICAAGLAVAGPAHAASGSLVNGVMDYTADPGESNQIVFTVNDAGEPTFEVRDAPGVNIAAQSPCFNFGANNVMDCPQDGNGSGAITILTASLGDGNDSITLLANLPTSIGAGGGADTMNGGPAADFLRGGQQDDKITGGDGNDQLVGDDPGVVGGGNDSLDGGTGDDSVDGQDGADTVTGGDGNDTLNGGGGNDRLLADGGQDDLFGGDGVDVADYSARAVPQFLSIDGVRNDGQDARVDNIQTDVENLIGSSAGDTMSGSDQPNVLDGGPGDDSIAGQTGDDSLIGGTGNDTASGGEGNDTADGGDGNDTLGGDAGNDTLTGAAGDDSESGGSGDDAESGGDGNDTEAGGDGNDSESGGAGNDRIAGDGGVDVMNGDSGDDSLDGGSGGDVFSGGDGVDTGDYSTRAAGVAVTLDGNPGDGEFGEGDNVEPDVENLNGGSGADTFVGSAAANSLDGGAGEDYSDGGPGADRLIGGDSGDVMRTRGSSDPDTVTCGPGPDFVVAKANDVIAPDCDRADRGVNQKPKLRDSAVVAPSRGTLQMSPAGIVRRVPLQDKVVLPLRSVVDTVAGAVKVTSAATARATQSISLRDGAFDITQTAAKLAVTSFALQGGDFAACPAGARKTGKKASAAQSKAKGVRNLWATGKGRFRTKGRYAAASIRGTRWETIDRCDGTLIRVAQGVVSVQDLVKKKTVVVKAGRSYLAKAP